MRPEPRSADVEYTVPERSGEVLIAPPLRRVPDLLAEGAAVGRGGAPVLGTPLDEFRRRVRARALRLAAAHSDAPPPDPGRPLVVMGHQPVLFHPGVWIKYFLLGQIARAHEATGLHLIVDTDATGPVRAEVPAQDDGRLTRTAETLLDLADEVPLEAAPPPAPAGWGAFVERVRRHVATLPALGLAHRLDAWAEAAPAAGVAGSLGTFLASLRRRYEARAGAPAYLELPLSRLAETPEFRAFAVHLLQDPAAMVRTYNGRLEAYRHAHRLRSSANPFPDLAADGDRVEAPFWVLSGGRRTALFVSRAKDRLALTAGSEPAVEVPAGPAGADALARAGMTLRPKAMTLTMFARLCLGDLFLHGVGGGRYDRVTDAITADLFGCPPAPYLVATATLHLPLPGEAAGEERRTLERRLMDLRHNPDRHLDALTDAQRRLVDEKWALIRGVEAMRPGPDRRAATRKIREVNAALAAALAPETERVASRLAALGHADSESVTTYRGYPFFLFDPAEVAALAGASRCPA